MPKVSIICPIHNSEQWITDTLESFINQTLKDIEILLIDDDSTDNTPLILKDYAKKDNRIKLFHRVHENNEKWGYTRAINIGRQAATGDYIIFPDSDDLLELDGLEKLYIQSSNIADLVKGGHDVLYKKSNELIHYPRPVTDGFINSWKDLNEQGKMLLFCNGTPQLQSFLIKRTFQQHIPFSTDCYMDTTTVFKLKVLARNIKYIDDTVYTSINYDKDYSLYSFEIIKVFDELEGFLKTYQIDPEIWSYFTILKFNTLLSMIPIDLSEQGKYLEILHRDLIRDNINKKDITNELQEVYEKIINSKYII